MVSMTKIKAHKASAPKPEHDKLTSEAGKSAGEVGKSPKEEPKQAGSGVLLPEVNIGTIGHVDHGKTSLVQTLTGVWASKYAEELKRGITIRLGYADATFYRCEKDGWCASKKCPKCFSDAKPVRAVSFIDAPGHETLMATVLSGAALMDGALLVIAANEKCPQPQTAEHLKALDIVGIRNVIIVQNKIDLVDEKRALESYKEIKNFVKGTVAENAPVIPISALHGANIDVLIDTIQKAIPTPERKLSAEPRFYVARSFDINKPGTAIDRLVGGVIGGSLTVGTLKIGDEIEIVPGSKAGDKYIPIKSRIVAIMQSGQQLGEAKPGGLVALQTELDPALTRGDLMSGNIAGIPGKLPPCADAVKFEPKLFDYVIGTEGREKVTPVKIGEPLLITAAVAKTVGVVAAAGGGKAEVRLKIPICIEKGAKLSLFRQVAGRWHLIGYGVII
jgi:translation initiation factor 2 subunit 3